MCVRFTSYWFWLGSFRFFVTVSACWQTRMSQSWALNSFCEQFDNFKRSSVGGSFTSSAFSALLWTHLIHLFNNPRFLLLLTFCFFLFVDHCFRSFCAILLFALSSFRLHPAFKNYFRNNSHSVDWITGRAFTYVFMFCFVILFTLIFFVALSFRFLSVINWYHIFYYFFL